MRYYLYIDKDFIQSLFGSIAESNFDIDIIEFSLSKSQTITKKVKQCYKIIYHNPLSEHFFYISNTPLQTSKIRLLLFWKRKITL